MIWKLFDLGDNLSANQNSSVQSKESIIKNLFKFGERVLSDPFFFGCVDQKHDLEFTDEVSHFIEVNIYRLSGILYSEKVFQFAF